MNGSRLANMPRRARPILKRSVISTGVWQHWRDWLKVRLWDSREIELQLARGLSLFTAEGFQSAEAARAYTRARELAEQRGDPRQLFMAIYGLWQSANGAARILDCRSLSNRLQQLTADDNELRLQAHHSARATYLFAGEPTVSRVHSEAGRRLYDPERHRLHHQLYGGHDPGMCPVTLVRKSIGCSDIPMRVLHSDARHCHWLSGYLIRSVSHLPCCTTRWFISIGPSRNWHCNYSKRPRRSSPSND